MDKKRKGGAEKARIKKIAGLKVIANDPKQKKISFGSKCFNPVTVPMPHTADVCIGK